MSRRPRIVAGLLLALTFAVGGLAGMALEEAMGLDWFEFLDADRDEENDRLLGGLGLSREQRARAEEILERQEDRLETYWERRLPEIQALLELSYTEIRSVLTPEQQTVFDERVRELGGRVPEEIRD